MQHCLKSAVTFKGVGLHSGQPVSMSVCPAAANHGIVFQRTDITGVNNLVPATYDYVSNTMLCTVLSNADNITVSTVEHVMAALRGCGIDNALITLDGPEVPIMDGSSQEFVQGFERVGLHVQAQPRKCIKVLKTVEVRDGDKWARIELAKAPSYEVEVDFDSKAIGQQKMRVSMRNRSFAREIADARTFGFKHEFEVLRKQNRVLGGSLDNALVFDGDEIVNTDGLRHTDEVVRHKLLDAVGDLYLADGVIIGHYVSYKAGHALNNQLLRALFEDKENFTVIDMFLDPDCEEDMDMMAPHEYRHQASISGSVR